MKHIVIIPTLFGIEAVTAGEIKELGYSADQVKVSDGQVKLFLDDYQSLKRAVARLNVFLRTAERVLVQVGEFPITDYDMLFAGIKAIGWEDLIVKDSAFHINGYSRKSQIYGIPSCQRIIKKAISQRLADFYGLDDQEQVPEDEGIGLLKIQFAIVADRATIMIDCSGEGLHKRGYRPLAHQAPIKETLAAAMLLISRYGIYQQEVLYDPFCGSGTILIEAALLAAARAPGIDRPFSAEKWPYIGGRPFDQARLEARQQAKEIDSQAEPIIFGSDIDAQSVDLARQNAQRAGVGQLIDLRCLDLKRLSLPVLEKWAGASRFLIVTNPPYGERMLEAEEADQLYRTIADKFLDGDGRVKRGLRLSVITPQKEFEQLLKGRADKRRKLYNGMIECTMYHYFKSKRV